MQMTWPPPLQSLHLSPAPHSPSECKHRNVDMTQKAPDGILGVPFAVALKKIKVRPKHYVIFVTCVISKKPGG